MGGPDTAQPREGPSFAGAVRKLTTLNIAVTFLGLASGILQARGLGPDGRGDLAAIIVPLYFLGWLGDFGLGLFARRESARAAPIGPLVATIGATVVGLGIVLAVGLQPAVTRVFEGRPVVRLWLATGLLVLPLNLLGATLVNIAFGLERWRLWVQSRLIQSVGWILALAALYYSGHLTVGAAAASLMAVTLLSYVPLVPLLSYARPFRYDVRLVRDAVRFGSRAWLANVTNLFNTRLDQLLMVRLVSPRELGLYTVAVTLAGFPSNFSGAVGLAILPGVVRQGDDLVPRAVRVVLAIVVLGCGGIALASWPFVHLLLGRRFSDALPMIWVVLLSEIPLAGTMALGQAFMGVGSPGKTAWAEGLAVAVTIGGLLLVLRPLGGLGAALVSLVAYSVSFGYLLVRSPRQFGRPIRAFLVPTMADLRWGRTRMRRLIRLRPSGAGGSTT